MKIATIIGARPQFVKAATVSRAIAATNGWAEVIVHTGQHYDSNMSDVFFEQMAISQPDHNLGVGSGLHGAMTGRQLEKIEEVLILEKPDVVMVYGDTNSTLAGALAAAKLNIPIAHVEAGLRSFNRRMPEEVNRVLTDHLSTFLFAPTGTARENLLAEGIGSENVYVVGDVMYDAAVFYRDRAVKPRWFDELGWSCGGYLLCTIHRAENTNEPERIRGIFQGLADFGGPTILPLHPRTRSMLAASRIEIPENIYLSSPVGYLEMVWLETQCQIVATDSGGVQKEAFFHGKPCVTFREETEWVELLDLGVNRLSGTDPRKIKQQLDYMIGADLDFSQKPFGSGAAAELIMSELLNAPGLQGRKDQTL